MLKCGSRKPRPRITEKHRLCKEKEANVARKLNENRTRHVVKQDSSMDGKVTALGCIKSDVNFFKH